jgi:16S rRNA (guanine527-N7)-methyltransferase
VTVSRETRERLELFVKLIEKWSSRINLVGRNDLSTLWLRHVEDSLQIAPLLGDPANRVIDLGSGAGFPGMVLAIAVGHPFHLIEADQRKAAFLREVARVVQAPAEIHACRIECSDLPSVGLITARALAPIQRLLHLAQPLLQAGGACVFLKGRGVDQELTKAAADWHMKVDQWQSRTAPDSRILRISEITLARRAGATSPF